MLYIVTFGKDCLTSKKEDELVSWEGKQTEFFVKQIAGDKGSPDRRRRVLQELLYGGRQHPQVRRVYDNLGEQTDQKGTKF